MHFFWLVSSFSIFKARKYSSFKSLVLTFDSYNHISFLWPLILLPLSYEDICGYTGSTWIVQDNSPLSRSLNESHFLKSLLLYKGHIQMLGGLEHGHLWWVINFVYYSLPSGSQRFMCFLHTKYIHPIPTPPEVSLITSSTQSKKSHSKLINSEVPNLVIKTRYIRYG